MQGMYGALVIEIDVDGEVFMRHVAADDTGSFQDLDVFVENGECHPDDGPISPLLEQLRKNRFGGQ